MQKNVWDNHNLITTLTGGGVAVMPTDTVYGIVGSTRSESTVSLIYHIRSRDLAKPCIILIGDIEELNLFSITLSREQKLKLAEYWPFDSAEGKAAPTSIVLDCHDNSLAYLHRGTDTLAFRLPASPELRSLLKKTGPLIAPSANKEKFPISESIEEAREYFGDTVDLYVDGGKLISKPSTVLKLHTDGSVSILRK